MMAMDTGGKALRRSGCRCSEVQAPSTALRRQARDPRQSGREPMSYSHSAQQALKERPTPAAAGNQTMKFDIVPTPNPTSDKDRAAKLVDPGFGRVFTDHMSIVRYNQAKG